MWKDFSMAGSSKEVKKVQINGKTAFERTSETYFNSSLAPTSWNEVTEKTEYTAANIYGTWRIWADNAVSSTRKVSNAFDGSDTTYWRSMSRTSSDVAYKIGIDAPVLINPKNIFIRSAFEGTSSYTAEVQGYDSAQGNWTTLGTITRSSTVHNTNITVSGDTYYSKFRALFYRFNSSYEYNVVYDFKITEGYYK